MAMNLDGYDKITADGTFTAGAAAVLVVASRPGRKKLLVQNRHATQIIYLGPTSAVTTSAYAWKIIPAGAGVRAEVDLGGYSGALYAIADGASTVGTFFEGYEHRPS